MATEQDHVWAMLDDMLVFLSKRHVPTPERTYKLDGGWTLAMDDLRRFVDALTAERDQLSAEVGRLRGEVSAVRKAGFTEVDWWSKRCAAATARAEAAERERDEAQAHAADLRAALDLARVQFDWVRQNSKPPVNGYSESSMWAVVVTAGRDASSALVRTPPQSLGRIKAKALKEMARLFMATAKSELSYHNRDLAARFCNAEADRLEATNGR
jgi:hypothetical protein